MPSSAGRQTRITFLYRELAEGPLQVTVSTYDQDGRKDGMTTWSPGPFESIDDIHAECHRIADRGQQLRLISD